ncbi:receptor-like protein 6 isoform X2 [Cryptomeria japonica]|uniref:receptor-like protein 6 isoform X2 n=1 Tax=Cryptomeria japonica TaxID=3369 RepID=UPI0027DA8AF0|nr:receptor-like protein 6 isoform X2 [Cryptomeria japonica]
MAVSLHILSLFLIFFFHFSFSNPFLSNRCHPNESEALLGFKAAFKSSVLIDMVLRSWVNGTDCCTQWEGISCDDNTNHVVSVEIYYLIRQGVISDSLCQLRFLRSLTILKISASFGTGASGIYICLGWFLGASSLLKTC